MLLWTRVLRVIEVHQDQTWQVTLQMNAKHHPGRMCLKELLVVSSDLFFVWLFTIDSCIAVAFTSREEATLTVKSHETVVDVVMCVWNTWTDVFLSRKLCDMKDVH